MFKIDLIFTCFACAGKFQGRKWTGWDSEGCKTQKDDGNRDGQIHTGLCLRVEVM